MNFQELERVSPGNWYYDMGDQLKSHIYRRSKEAFDAGDAARDAIRTLEQLKERQQFIRKQLLDGIGGLPSMDTPLQAQIVGTIQRPGFRIEKVIFQSRPRNYVTANLYVPDNLREPGAAVQFVCGHFREAKHAPEYQSVCQALALAGLVVLAQDPIGQGERFSYYDPSTGESAVMWGCPEHDYAGVQCLPLGDAIARYFLHDSMRGIDYLCSRPEVDPQKIGVTGNSGGGVQSSLMMMADPRIAAAAPATFIMNRHSYQLAGGAQDAEQIWPGFTAAGLDHEDILIAMAPRPVRVLAVKSDFFPIEGTRRTVSRCKRIWELAGAPEDLDLIEDFSTHSYTPTLARAAAAFFSRHLLNREPGSPNARIEPLPEKDLWCTTSGQVRGELDSPEAVFEANKERLQELKQQRESQASVRDRGRAWLHEKVHNHRRPCDLNPRFYHTGVVEGLEAESCFWWSQEDLFNHGCLLRHLEFTGQSLPVTLALWNGGTTCLDAHRSWIEDACKSRRAIMVLDVSGEGALTPRAFTDGAREGFYGVLHKLTTDLLWLDDDLVSLRTFDVLRALEMLSAWPRVDSNDIQIYAEGRIGLYGRLASILDNRVQDVQFAGGILSFSDWVQDRLYDSTNIYTNVLRGVLRNFDLPELESSPAG